MALNITSPVTTLDGIELATSYARIEVRNPVAGTDLIAGVFVYPTETAFTSGKDPLNLANPVTTTPFSNFWVMPYDRNSEGTDILILAHEYIQFQLNAIGVSSTITGL